MYIPSHFAQHDLGTLHDAIESYSFATLISHDGGAMTASHLPLLLEREEGASGTLIGHMARANSHWEQAAGKEVLVIFAGPHCYVSPTWYQDENVVPTWNYVAVHAYGRLELQEDPAESLAVISKMVETYERGMPKPWRFDDSSEFVSRLVRQIVAFRIPITRLEGKWKLNQNHPPARRDRVIAELQSREDENSQSIARLMKQLRTHSS